MATYNMKVLFWYAYWSFFGSLANENHFFVVFNEMIDVQNPQSTILEPQSVKRRPYIKSFGLIWSF